MALIGLAIRPGIEEAVCLGKEIIRWVDQNSHEILLENQTAEILDPSRPKGSAQDLALKADPIISLGGDGTLIGIARHSGKNPPTMIGVNFGHLGFLTEIRPEEVIKSVEDVLAGKALLAYRAMLLCEIYRDDKLRFSSQAVNDAVIQKGARDKLMHIDVWIGEEELVEIRADGLIFTTPTGSTAYSLSAGGAILYPSLSVVELTPMCPHSLTFRPLVLPMESMLKVTVPESYTGETILNIDGQLSCDFTRGDEVRITKSPTNVQFARSPSKSYFEILRRKLNWGIPNKFGE